ncbi:cation diffusion facilitator family transporter [Puniceicoccus vermicola]|uniref:Cation transporter n=1 Tax=Puniceicoccus vermicola TaxID=388746 RepID=A0A7X1B045_9BACT|nr:cation diffusion facilitator family transporter [Puniceicoccus vermicola]MBC2603117.1 cation transporter [Puniceicoccus vermicola]
MREDKQGYRVTAVSFALNLVLGSAKLGAGLWFHSSALLADGLHSLTDLVSDLAVFFGLAVAGIPEDENHPYGHHKFASFAQLFIGILLFALSVGLVIAAVMDFQRDEWTTPGSGAVWVAGFSLLAKECMYWWTRAVAVKMQSDLLMANAWHHRTDSFSSLAVCVALVGIWIGGPGWSFLDPLLSLVLGVWLIREAFRICARAGNDLLDAAPKREIVEDLREHILPIEGARAYHDFRARKIGDFYEIDLHLQVDPHISVEEGHQIAKEVKDEILRTHPEVIRALVHLEPATREHLLEKGISDVQESQ